MKLAIYMMKFAAGKSKERFLPKDKSCLEDPLPRQYYRAVTFSPFLGATPGVKPRIDFEEYHSKRKHHLRLYSWYYVPRCS